MSERLTDQEYEYVYSRVNRLCVDLVEDTGDGILLTKRAIRPYEGEWHLPGGMVAFREPVVSAAERIALKELNVGIETVRLLGHIEFIDPPNYEIPYSTISLAYLVRTAGNIELNEEATEWGRFKDLPTPIIPQHRDFLVDYLENK